MNWLSNVYATLSGLAVSIIGTFLDFPEPLVSFLVIIIIVYFLVLRVFRINCNQ
ncbi:hypothetical protein [Bacillus sp. UNC41MFS5]|uniref:hypothetical protein n=1 Tax=Bacillus sp. UNC41MFS5 TaxID=1449046 RepID=UPI0012DC12CB|nr:hypothetical protein [Bacillus sp. UNC41MFS5]